jgi:hypothetical protein
LRLELAVLGCERGIVRPAPHPPPEGRRGCASQDAAGEVKLAAAVEALLVLEPVRIVHVERTVGGPVRVEGDHQRVGVSKLVHECGTSTDALPADDDAAAALKDGDVSIERGLVYSVWYMVYGIWCKKKQNHIKNKKTGVIIMMINKTTFKTKKQV